MNYLRRGYIALVVGVLIGTARFATSGGQDVAVGKASTRAVSLAARANTVRSALLVTPVRTTHSRVIDTPTISPVLEGAIRDDSSVVEGALRDDDQPITDFSLNQTNGSPNDASRNVELASAESTTAPATMTATVVPPPMTATLPVTVEPPPMTPEELAAAEATIRDGQARMSNARTEYRLNALADGEAEVSAATANLEQVRADNVKPEDVARAEIEVQNAQADFDSIRAENVDVANIEQAEADVRAAEARLAEAQARTTADPAARAAAEERVVIAQQHYEATVSEASARKTVAEQTMNDATATLQAAQATYSTSYWQNEQAQQGIDPVSGQQFSDVGLDPDAQKLSYALAFAAAQANLADAQIKLDAAVAVYEAARQQEVTDVEAAQIALTEAQTALAQLPQGTDSAAIAQAQQDVDSARAHLANILQSVPALAEAQQRVEAAQTQLDAMRVGWATAEPLIAEAQQRLDDAQAVLSLARQQAVGEGGWTWPTYGTLSSGFGKRSLLQNTFHNGIDIANDANTPIAAARAGTVTEAGWCEGYGYCVRIAHDGGFSSEYGHMAAMPLVKAGDQVAAGTLIGLMGTTYDEAHGGYSTGVHLHFTILDNGIAVDPLGYLP